MAKAAPSAGGLGALLGGGGLSTAKGPGGKIPWWGKLAMFVGGTLVLFVLSGSLGAFVILFFGCLYIGWSWMREKGNVVDTLVAWVVLLAFLATVLRAPILKAGDGVRDIGPSTTDAVTESVRAAWPDGGVQIPQTVPPTTTAPIVLPDPAPVVVAAP